MRWPPVPRNRLWIGVQVLFIALALWFAGEAVVRQWAGLRALAAEARPRWSLVALATLMVLAVYALLIQVWRALLVSWGSGGRLSLREAARVWFVSNLGRYVPGKVWQISTMAVMAQRRGFSPVTATGAALVVNLASVASGFVVVLATGAAALPVLGRAGPRLGVLIGGILIAGLLFWPVALRAATPFLARLTRGRMVLPPLAARPVWLAALGTAVAWVLYGVAFEWFGTAFVGRAGGATPLYIAAFTGSYLVGYLAVLAPGGIVVRELALSASLTNLGLLTGPEAWLVAIASRLWLTLLEALPGLLFLLLPGERS